MKRQSNFVSARGSIDRKQIRRTGIGMAAGKSRGSPAIREPLSRGVIPESSPALCGHSLGRT